VNSGNRGGLTGQVKVPQAPGPIQMPDGSVINGTTTPAGAVQLGAYLPFILIGVVLLVALRK
jgi:hypothetical protein